jgi:aminoglycoside phosphotransferase
MREVLCAAVLDQHDPDDAQGAGRMLTQRPWAFLAEGAAGRWLDRIRATIAADSQASALLRASKAEVACDLKLRVKSSGSPAVKSLYWSVRAPDPASWGGQQTRTLVADADKVAWLNLPVDPALPALAGLQGEGGDWRMLRYLPLRRATLWHLPTTGSARIIKLKRPDRAADAARRLTLVHAALGQDRGFEIPKLLDIRSDGVMALSICPGVVPEAALRADPALILRDLGRLLARLHVCSPRDLPPDDPPQDSLPLIAALRPDLTPALSGLSDILHQRPAASRPVLCHGDFGFEQILLGPQGLSLLDFDRSHAGEGVADLARFLLVLAETPPGGITAAAAQAAFLAGYAELAETPEPTRLRWFLVEAMVNRLLVCLRKDQPKQIERLLALARPLVPA